MNNLHDSVERWLVQDGRSVTETKTEDNFKIIIENIDAFSNNLEIFEPKQQAGVLVIGVKIPLKSKQMIRYRILNQKEQENFEKKMTDFCYSIQAINKFFDEDGMKKVGVYIVLDKKEQLNQPTFIATLTKIIEKLNPDIILSGFDIGANLSAAIVGAHMNKVVAHLEGGEVTGTIDESIRHATTKFAHIHFTTNEIARIRLIKMGENQKLIFTVGNPSLDNIKSIKKNIKNG